MQPNDTPSTDVYHDGDEVAVRLNSKTSRKYHEPKTNDDGDVVFDEDDRPVPACGTSSPDGKAWILTPVSNTGSRGSCDNCTQDADAISERNAKGSGNMTPARLAQRGDFKGAESLRANASQE